MFRKSCGSLALAAAASLVAPLAAFAPAHAQKIQQQFANWELIFNQEFRYSSWEGTRGYPAASSTARGSGHQFYSPVTVAMRHTQPDVMKFEFTARGGYVDSKQSSAGLTGSVSTMIDTVAALTWTYLGAPGIQPFFTVNVNAPTGKATLRGSDIFARMDPDLVDVPTFGEGWNYGVTAGFNYAVADNMIFSFGVGHTWRGDYDRGDSLPASPVVISEVKPGDVTAVSAALLWRRGIVTSQITGSYSHEGTSALNATQNFQLGDRYTLASNTVFNWSESSATTLASSWVYTEKNKNPPPGTEAFNSNSSVYRVRLDHAAISGPLSWGPLVSFLYRDKNAWSPSGAAGFNFVPAKTRWSAGGQSRYSVSNTVSLYGSAEYVWISEDAQPGGTPNPVPNAKYEGWNVALGGLARF